MTCCWSPWPQEPRLFKGTVAENITWGLRDVNFEDIVSAAKVDM